MRVDENEGDTYSRKNTCNGGEGSDIEEINKNSLFFVSKKVGRNHSQVRNNGLSIPC